MRVPNDRIFKRSDWQRFFAGLVIGAVLSWGVFLCLYGILQEKQSRLLTQHADKIADLNKELSLWKSENEELNKQNKKRLIIQEVQVKIVKSDAEKYLKSNNFLIYQIQESAKEEIEHLISKDIEEAYNSKDLLKRAIENKTYEIDKMKYRVEVHEIFFYTNLTVQLKIKDIKKVL